MPLLFTEMLLESSVSFVVAFCLSFGAGVRSGTLLGPIWHARQKKNKSKVNKELQVDACWATSVLVWVSGSENSVPKTFEFDLVDNAKPLS